MKNNITAKSGDEDSKRNIEKRRVVVGVVVSDKMQKTIRVDFNRKVKHPRYHKFIRKTSKYYAHDETEQAKIGDKVKIVETRPLSKLKRWKLLEVLDG